MHVTFERLYPDTQIPTRATEGSSGYDLRACISGRTIRCSDGVKQWNVEIGTGASLTLQPGQSALVPLGFKAQLPRGIEAQIRPRSGAAFKKGLHLANSPGTVDSDYPDEWLVPVHNASVGMLEVAHGERIAQMILARYEVLAFTEGAVGKTTTREGGFGSTGS